MLFLFQGIFKRIPAKPNQALMKISALSLAILLFGHAYSQKEIDLVISNPTIINVENGSVTLRHDILIKGNTITGIVPHRKKYNSSITVADASNKYVIPGLWDMHIHFGGGDSLLEENKALLPLFIANGIAL